VRVLPSEIFFFSFFFLSYTNRLLSVLFTIPAWERADPHRPKGRIELVVGMGFPPRETACRREFRHPVGKLAAGERRALDRVPACEPGKPPGGRNRAGAKSRRDSGREF
jgi:hypothetical protein